MKLRKIHLLYLLIGTIQSLISFSLLKLVSIEYELFEFNTRNSLDINIQIYGVAIFATSIIAVIILNRISK